MKHFYYCTEGRYFSIQTYQKPLIFARQNCSWQNPQEWQFDYLAQFTFDIQHIKDSNNQAVVALSRRTIANVVLPESNTDYKKAVAE